MEDDDEDDELEAGGGNADPEGHIDVEDGGYQGDNETMHRCAGELHLETQGLSPVSSGFKNTTAGYGARKDHVQNIQIALLSETAVNGTGVYSQCVLVPYIERDC